MDSRIYTDKKKCLLNYANEYLIRILKSHRSKDFIIDCEEVQSTEADRPLRDVGKFNQILGGAILVGVWQGEHSIS